MEAVCLASGGIDSTVLLFRLKQKGFSLHPLIINYGHKAYRMERNSLAIICKRLHLHFDEINISGIDKLPPKLGNPVISTSRDGSFFPGRNLLLLTIACSYAAYRNIEIVAIGIIAGTSFSDQTKEFLKNSQIAINSALGSRIEILAPLIKLNKLEVIRLAKKHHIPYLDTYSCNVGNRQPCNECLSCKDRNNVLLSS